MNFAAFKYLATGLTTFRLDASCLSEACAHRPFIDIPQVALVRFQFKPDPESPVFSRYQELIQEFLPYLAGELTFSGVAPTIPGIVANPPLPGRGAQQLPESR